MADTLLFLCWMLLSILVIWWGHGAARLKPGEKTRGLFAIRDEEGEGTREPRRAGDRAGDRSGHRRDPLRPRRSFHRAGDVGRPRP